MSKPVEFALKLAVTVMIAAALSFAFRGEPMRAQAQDSHAAHDAGGQAMMQANQTMMDAMAAMQPTGDTDKDFATMMIVHHQGAIDMARVELAHGDDADMQALAEKVIAEQEREIAEMQEWLAAQP